MKESANRSFRNLKLLYKESYKLTENIFKFNDENKDFEFSLKDKVLIGLFEEVLRATKSIIILIDANNPSSIGTIVRKIFESRLYIQYLLEKNKEVQLRARSYYLNYYKNAWNLARKTLQKDRIGTEIRQEFGIDTSDWVFTEKTLNEKLDRIEKDFSDVLQFRRMKDPWYNLDGKTNTLESLALKLNMRPHYEVLYRLYSQDTHSSNSLKAIEITDQMDELNRNLIYVTEHKETVEDVDLSILATRNHVFEITKMILKHYKMNKELRGYKYKTSILL